MNNKPSFTIGESNRYNRRHPNAWRSKNTDTKKNYNDKQFIKKIGGFTK